MGKTTKKINARSLRGITKNINTLFINESYKLLRHGLCKKHSVLDIVRMCNPLVLNHVLISVKVNPNFRVTRFLFVMDPLAALRLEISKKRNASNISSRTIPSVDGHACPSSVRWQSQADLEHSRERAYYEREKETWAEKSRSKRRRTSGSPSAQQKFCSKSDQPSKLIAPKSGSLQGNVEENLTSTKYQEKGLVPQPSSVLSGDDSDVNPPLEVRDVKRRLRAMKQPATLFGEDVWDRFRRLRALQLSREDNSDGHNLYQKKIREIKAKHAEEDIYDYARATLPIHARQSAGEPKDESGNTLNGDGVNGDSSICKEDFVQGVISKYLRLWQAEIDALSKEERRTKTGRTQLAIYEQTRQWLRPLEKLLRRRTLSRKILDALRDIFEAAGRREYTLAMRLYLEQLAIGKAPWPMGATQVGIHSRAAREKIGEDKIAHVMNDELTRKYIQAVKRLLTVAERHYPMVRDDGRRNQ